MRIFRGLALACLIGYAALRLGGVEEIVFYPIFLGLVLLFLVSLIDGIRVEWWGWILLVPLVPMMVNGSYPFEILQFVALWLAIVLASFQMRKDWDAGKKIPTFIYMILAIGALEAVLGLSQSLGRFAGKDIPFFPVGTIYNRNHFAGFLELLVPMCFAIGMVLVGARRRRSAIPNSEFRIPNSAHANLESGGRDSASRSIDQLRTTAKRRANQEIRNTEYGIRNHRGIRNRRDEGAKSWLFLLIGGVLFLAILFSLSRGGAVAAVCGTVTAGTLLWLRMKGEGRTRSDSRFLIGGIGTLVVVAALWIGMQPVVERFLMVPEHADDRSGIWVGTVQIIQENPLAGVGGGMHGWAFTRFNDRNPDTFYDYAHNDYLQAAAEWGLPAALIFFGTLFFLVWQAGKACVDSENRIRAGLIAGGVGGVVALLVHSFVDFNFYIPSNAMLFGLVFGAACGLARTVEVRVIVPARKRSNVKTFEGSNVEPLREF